MTANDFVANLHGQAPGLFSEPVEFVTEAPKAFFERMLHLALKNLHNGRLLMQLPDGKWRVYGTGLNGHDAIMHVHNPAFFQKCTFSGDIGFGESYTDGDWSTPNLTAVISWFIINADKAPHMSGSKGSKSLFVNWLKWSNWFQHLSRNNSLTNSRKNISDHYDLSNEFFSLWLDPTMTYSSAYFQSPELTLEQAQRAKYDALCRKLRLKPTDHVLEIGSGWGGFSLHAVKNYGCRVTTLTLSERQKEFAERRFQEEGVADRIDIRLQDYRLVTGEFDKVASIEMIEAVGDQYVDGYFKKIHEVLKPRGLVGIQMITVPDSRYTELRDGVDWIQKHVFPGSLLMSVGRVQKALERGTDLFLHHYEDIGVHYARTLREWREQFNQSFDAARPLGFDDQFYRKWNYYLCYCEAAFGLRHISVVQAVYTRANNLSL
jgi:cyclopropane-fatty-acyl-phospholipid synthase